MSLLKSIDVKLKAAYQPTYLTLTDQSHLHQGHIEAGPDGESHVNIILVSPVFEGMNRVARQKHVHQVLQEELNQLHAIQLRLMTPEEWEAIPRA